jgi:hypothetical protein
VLVFASQSSGGNKLALALNLEGEDLRDDGLRAIQ